VHQCCIFYLGALELQAELLEAVFHRFFDVSLIMQVKPMDVCKLGPNGKPDDACDIKVHGAKVMNGLLFVLFYCYCCLSFWQHARTH
jgi:hypothetical protein